MFLILTHGAPSPKAPSQIQVIAMPLLGTADMKKPA
ncbi:Uncharacterised protein [Vibrio cholerae]|nr:Uncharacterised protein [Vibrio cholerae]